MPSTTSISRLPDYDEQSITSGFFVQDDWRVNNRLTLNLGLRYEVETALTESQDRSVSGFDSDYVQPIQAAAQANYAALNDPALKALVPQLNVKGGLMFAGVDGGERALHDAEEHLPAAFRVGLPVDSQDGHPRRRRAVRRLPWRAARRRDPVGLLSNDHHRHHDQRVRGADPAYWDNAFITTPIIEPVGNAAGRQTFLGQGISFFNQDPKVSKQLRWQMGLQRELPGGMTVEAAYVGNYGYDIEITPQLNALPNQYLNTDNSRSAAMNANNTFLTAPVANPFAGLLPGTGFNNPTIARSQLLLPYPAFGAINTTNNDGKSWYHAGQFGLQKRFSNGYTLGVSYTYSKWTQATEYLNAADPQPTKMISDLDVTNRLSVNGIYALPVRERPAVRVGCERDHRGPDRRLAGSGGLHLADRLPDRVRDRRLLQRRRHRAPVRPANHRQVVQHGRLHVDADRSGREQLHAGQPSAHAADCRFTDVRRDSINNLDLSLIKNVRLQGAMQASVEGRVHQRP